MSNNPKSPEPTWSNLTHSDETQQAKEAVPSTWDKIASSLAGVGEFAAGFVAEQAHHAGQDFVSRVLLNESYTPPEPDRDRDQEKDKGLDR